MNQSTLDQVRAIRRDEAPYPKPSKYVVSQCYDLLQAKDMGFQSIAGNAMVALERFDDPDFVRRTLEWILSETIHWGAPKMSGRL